MVKEGLGSQDLRAGKISVTGALRALSNWRKTAISPSTYSSHTIAYWEWAPRDPLFFITWRVSRPSGLGTQNRDAS